MFRTLTAAAVCLALAACGGSSSSDSVPRRDGPRASLSTQNVSDGRVAKALFGAMRAGSAQSSEAIGFYSRGCAAGNIQLAETGPNWQAMRLSRNRNWGQPILIDFLQDLSAFAAAQPGWSGLYVGDLSQPRGGPMLTGHASHQIGLDADIWMLPATRLNLSAAERESLSSIRTDQRRGAFVNDAWTPSHMAIVRRAAQDPRVQRIFIFPGAKVAMCDAERGDRSYLSKLRLLANHNYHFHVRLHCPPGDACEPQDPVPAGDGCAEARQAVANILNPPPPDPTYRPPPPRRDLTVADLPGQCVSVLASE